MYCGVFIGFARTKLPIAINVARVWLLRYVFIRIAESRIFLQGIMEGIFHYTLQINYTVIPWATVFSNTVTALFALAVYRTLRWEGDHSLVIEKKKKKGATA